MKAKLPILCIAVAAASVASGARKSGDSKTVTLPGGATMELVWCEPGKFEMGSPVDETGRFENEPRHAVTITKGFWLGKYEVTQRQWESVMHSNHARFKNPDNPMENVSWNDCEAFIRRINANGKFGGIYYGGAV